MQPDLAASIKQNRTRRAAASSETVHETQSAAIEPTQLRSVTRERADESTRPLGTRVAESVHEDLAEYLARANQMARSRKLKKFTQRELVERALRDLMARDPESLL